MGLVALLGPSLAACKSAPWPADPSAAFFPLKPNMVWIYKVQSKSQQREYVVTDKVIGQQYVPALKVTGDVVQEFYNTDRAGLRPIVYIQKGGYLSRLSGLDYVHDQIKPPAWGRSTDEGFLPQRLAPDSSWDNKLFPYGKLPGSFDLLQNHKSFLESHFVTVPAGRYGGCIRIETLARYEGGAYSHQPHPLKLAYEDWYAPNVGLVRTVAYEGGPSGPEMERVELIKFDAGDKVSAKSVEEHRKS
jgi:hypothetical protein